MKRFISILLFFSISIGFIIKSLVIINYQVDKTNFIAKFCENKNKPELNCEGKCHLMKQLNETSSSENESSLPESITQYEIPSFIVPRSTFKLEFTSIWNSEKHRSHATLLLNGYLSSVFKPPIV
ncbi:MAG: hypothetical protein Q8K70_12990 [Bacteroidota bacterium]|nr:hypothetical protein [Bacteroidota bacterium]